MKNYICFNEGYNAFEPDKLYDDILLVLTKEEKIHFTNGWLKAKREYLEQQAEDALLDCPFCGGKCGLKYSGLYCRDEEYCGYHTHFEE